MEFFKVLHNSGDDGFGVPHWVSDRYEERNGVKLPCFVNVDRADYKLIEIVEEYKNTPLGTTPSIVIYHIPKGCEYRIHQYDNGTEKIDWWLPNETIINGNVSTMNPLTRKFLESGKSFKEFEKDFKNEALLIKKSRFGEYY